MYRAAPLSGCPSDDTWVREFGTAVHTKRYERDCSITYSYLSLSKHAPVAAVLAEDTAVAVLWIF